PTFTLVTVCAQRTNNSCAPFNDAGAMEVNQGLPDTMYPLVAGKETLVRLYLGSSVASGFAAVDLGMLTIIGPNGTSVRFADIPKRTFNNPVRTFSEKANANFYLDGSEVPLSGGYTFIVDLFSFGADVYHAQLTANFQPTRDLRFVVVNWSDGKPVTPTIQVWDELASEQRAIATLARVYPVRRGVGFQANCTNCGVQFTLS